MFEANKALSYFVVNNWNFKNDRFLALSSFLRLEDIKEFESRQDFYWDKILCIRMFVFGFRRYLLKEKDETIEKCQKRYRRLTIVNFVLQSILYLTAFYVIFFKYDLVRYLKAL